MGRCTLWGAKKPVFTRFCSRDPLASKKQTPIPYPRCLIFFGEDSLGRALEQFSAHFHREGNHQGLDNRIIDAGNEIGRTSGELQCRERLGGMFRYYYREAG